MSKKKRALTRDVTPDRPAAVASVVRNSEPSRVALKSTEPESVSYTVSQILDDFDRLQAVIATFQMLTHANEDEVNLVALRPIAEDGYEALASFGELTTALTQGSWHTGARITLTFDPEPPDTDPSDDAAGAE